MDQLVKLLPRCPDRSPLEMLNFLVEHCPEQIKFLRYSTSPTSYTSTVLISQNRKLFISNESDEAIASEKVAIMVLNYLSENNSAVEKTQKDDIGLLKDFKTLNLSHQPPVVNEDPSTPQASPLSPPRHENTSLQPYEDNPVEIKVESCIEEEEEAFHSNNDVVQYLSSLRIQGLYYPIVSYQDLFNEETRGRDYQATIRIAKLGVFQGISPKSKRESLKVAAIKLKSHLETLHNNNVRPSYYQPNTYDNQVKHAFLNENQADIEIDLSTQYKYSNNGHSPRIVDDFERSPKDKLNYKDYRKAILLNNFISVYDGNKSKLEIIKNLINIEEQGAFNFQVSSTSNNSLNHASFKTILDVRDFFSFSASSFDKQESLNQTMYEAYNSLMKIVQFFVSFKMEYSNDKTPMELVEKLIALHEEIISMSVSRTNFKVNVTIIIKHATEFSDAKFTEPDAKFAVCTKVVSYLLRLTDKICLSTKLLEDVLKNRIIKEISDSTQELNNSSSCQLSLNIDGRIDNRIIVMNTFNLVNSFDKSPEAILKLLNGYLSPPLCVIMNTEGISDGMGFITTARIEGISLEVIADAELEVDSQMKASKKIVDYLNNVANMVTNFKSIYSPYKSPAKIMDQIIATNRNIIKVSTSKNREVTKLDKRYLAVVQLMNMISFANTASDELDAKNGAMLCAFDYLLKFSNEIK